MAIIKSEKYRGTSIEKEPQITKRQKGHNHLYLLPTSIHRGYHVTSISTKTPLEGKD